MKLIGGRKPSWYVGLMSQCQHCGQTVEFEESDMKMHSKLANWLLENTGR